MTDTEAMDYYVGMGPPYIATAKDMYTIVKTWAEIVPRVHNDYPHLLAGALFVGVVPLSLFNSSSWCLTFPLLIAL